MYKRQGLKEVASPESVAYRRYDCIYDCSGPKPQASARNRGRGKASAQNRDMRRREDDDIPWEQIFKDLGVRYERLSTNTFLSGDGRTPSGRGADQFRKLLTDVCDDLARGRKVLIVCVQGQCRSVFLVCALLLRATDGRPMEFVRSLRALAYPKRGYDERHCSVAEGLHYLSLIHI